MTASWQLMTALWQLAAWALTAAGMVGMVAVTLRLVLQPYRCVEVASPVNGYVFLTSLAASVVGSLLTLWSPG